MFATAYRKDVRMIFLQPVAVVAVNVVCMAVHEINRLEPVKRVVQIEVIGLKP
jgi:hypothetical protein